MTGASAVTATTRVRAQGARGDGEHDARIDAAGDGDARRAERRADRGGDPLLELSRASRSLNGSPYALAGVRHAR